MPTSRDSGELQPAAQEKLIVLPEFAPESQGSLRQLERSLKSDSSTSSSVSKLRSSSETCLNEVLRNKGRLQQQLTANSSPFEEQRELEPSALLEGHPSMLAPTVCSSNDELNTTEAESFPSPTGSTSAAFVITKHEHIFVADDSDDETCSDDSTEGELAVSQGLSSGLRLEAPWADIRAQIVARIGEWVALCEAKESATLRVMQSKLAALFEQLPRQLAADKKPQRVQRCVNDLFDYIEQILPDEHQEVILCAFILTGRGFAKSVFLHSQTILR